MNLKGSKFSVLSPWLTWHLTEVHIRPKQGWKLKGLSWRPPLCRALEVSGVACVHPTLLSSSANLSLTAGQTLSEPGRAGSSYRRAHQPKWDFTEEGAPRHGKAESGGGSPRQREAWPFVSNSLLVLSMASVSLLISSRLLIFKYLFKSCCS